MNSEAKKFSIIAGFAIIVIAAGVVLMLRSSSGTPSAPGAPADPALLTRINSSQTGPATAPVTLVEFGDYECPACAAAFPILKPILDSYGLKLNFVFRHFPLPMHNSAPLAAEAAEAAGSQGKYWQMHELLYTRQQEWAEKPNAFDVMVGYAQQLGLNVDQFRQDVQSNKFADKISGDMKDGQTLGINATPTFYVNGKQIVGVPKDGDLRSMVDAIIHKK